MIGWQILFNDNILYDPRGANEDDKLITLDEDIELGVNMIGSASLTLRSDHPHLHALTRMYGNLTLRQDGVTRFRGRLHGDIKQLSGGVRVSAEELTACLRDSVVPPYDFPGDFENSAAYQALENKIEFWFCWLIVNHNAQVGPSQQLHAGRVTVTDPNNFITRSNQTYSTTWETIKEKLFESSLGGYLITRYEDDGIYLDYLADLPRTNIQQVRYGHNLRDLSDEVDSSEFFTAILPTGKDGLTIDSLPDGDLCDGFIKSGKIIRDTTTEERTGLKITRHIEYSDITEAANLRAAAIKDVRQGTILPHTLECKAADLSGTDSGIPPLVVGQYVEVTDDVGNTALYPLTFLRPNIHNPGQTEIIMGRSAKTLTRTIAKANAAFAVIDDMSKRLDILGRTTVKTTDFNALVDLAERLEGSTPIIITHQPESQTVSAGNMTTVSVTASGEELTYQWYFREGAGEYQEIENSSSTFVAIITDNSAAYCVIADKYGNTVQSATATITVEA